MGRKQKHVRHPLSDEPDIQDPDDIAVTVMFDDGTEREFAILTIFTADCRDYIALIPYNAQGEPDPDADIYFYRYYEDEEENASIGNIETEEEFLQASQAFNALMTD